MPPATAATKVTLRELADLAIGTPELGAVNFTALHTLIVAMLKCLNLRETRIDFQAPSPEQGLSLELPQASLSAPQLAMPKERRRSSGAGRAPPVLEGQVKELGAQVQDLSRQLKTMGSQVQGIASHVQHLSATASGLDANTRRWLEEKETAMLMPEKPRMEAMKIRKDSEAVSGPRTMELLHDVTEDMKTLKEVHQKAQELPELNPQKLVQRVDELERLIRGREEFLDQIGRKLSVMPVGEEVTMVTWEELEQAITDGWRASQQGSDSTIGLPKRKGQASLTSSDATSTGGSTKHSTADQPLESASGFGPSQPLSATSGTTYPSEGMSSRERSRRPSPAVFPGGEQHPRARDEAGLAKPYHPAVSQFRVESDRRRAREQHSLAHPRRDERDAHPAPFQQDLPPATSARDWHPQVYPDQHGGVYISQGQIYPRLDQHDLGPLETPDMNQLALLHPSTYHPHGIVPHSTGQLGVMPPMVPGRDQQRLELPRTDQPSMVPLSTYQHGMILPGTDQRGVEQPGMDENVMGPLGMDQHGLVPLGMDQHGSVIFSMDQQGLGLPSMDQHGLVPPLRDERGLVSPGLMQVAADQQAFVHPSLETSGFIQPGASQPALVQAGAGQPGVVQPGAGQPALVQPGVGQPGMVQPGAGQPGVVQPGVGQPGMVQPGAGQPGVVQPGAGQPGVVQPGAGQPGVVQPGAGRHAVVQPGIGQPGMVQPGAGQPGVVQPGAGQPGVVQPGAGRHAVVQPGIGQPGMVQPGAGQPGVVQPGTRQPGVVQPGARQPGVGQPRVVQPRAGQPALVQPGARQPGVVQPGAGRPALVQPGAGQPGVVQPSARQPGVVQPGVGQHSVVQPGAGQPGVVQPVVDQSAYPPGWAQPGTYLPGLVQPGADQPGLAQHGTDQPGLMQPHAYLPSLAQPSTDQPGLVQPGMDQPGLVQPGVGQPGLAQPGLAQPGMDQHGLVQPGVGRPGLVQPGMDQRGLAQPGVARPGLVQPGMDQRGLVQPGVARPGLVQPGMDQRGLVQPGVGQPGLVQPGMDQRGLVQPGVGWPGLVQPGMDQQGMVQPGVGQPGLVQPGMYQRGLVQPGMDQWGLVQPGMDQHGLVQPEKGQPDLLQPGAGQHGLVQTGMEQRGLVQPGAGQPGSVQPGTDQGGLVQPATDQPGLVQPGSGQPGLAQPGAGQAGLAQPGAGQPGLAQPGAGQPGLAQPGAGQPGLAQPGAGQPGLAQPGAGQPGLAQPGAGQPGLAQPGAGQAGLAQPGAGQPGLAQPGAGQPGLAQPGAGQAGLAQPGAGQPGLVQPSARHLGFVQPGVDQRGLVQPGTDPRGFLKPSIYTPGLVSPDIYPPGPVQPGAYLPGLVQPGAYPRGLVPSGVYPHGLVQPGAYPHSLVQAGAYPHGFVQPGLDQRGLRQPGTDQQGLIPLGTELRRFPTFRADSRNFISPRPYQHSVVPPGRTQHGQVSPLPANQDLALPGIDQEGLVPPETYQHGVMHPGTDQPSPAPLSTGVRSARLDQQHLVSPGPDQRDHAYSTPVSQGVDRYVQVDADPNQTYASNQLGVSTQTTPTQDATFFRRETSLNYLDQVSSEKIDVQSERRESLDKLAPSFPMAVETFRLMGELIGLYVELKENMKDLDEQEAGQTDLEKIQYLLALMVKKTIPPDLQEQLKTLKTLTKEIRQEKAKLDKMQKVVEGDAEQEIGKDMKTGQLTMQLGILRVTVADIEKELAELRESQEQGKVSMENSVSEASLYLQNQLDKLRTIIESMLTSSSTLLSMSMAPHKTLTTLAPGQIDPEATCPACSLDLSHQVSTLVRRYEQLQDMVNNLTTTRPSKKTKLQSQDEELLGHVQRAILQVQGDCEKLNITTSNLIEDHRQKQKDIDVLYQGLEKLEKEKANRENLEMEIGTKADKSALAAKVSRVQFDATTEQLNHMMQELVAKMSGQEQDWQKMLDKLLLEMDTKLDRLELDPVKQLLEDRWKSLRQQLKERSPLYQADEAAAMRRQLLAHFHCLSCDRPLETPVTGQIIPVTPVCPGLPGHRSIRPYTVFELEQVRQQSRNLKLGSAPFPRSDLAQMERSVGRLRTMHSKMLMDIEKVQIHFGGSVKASSQMIRELLQAQCLRSPCYKRVHDPADYTYSTVPRRCGGSHTRTYPYRRNRLQHLAQGLYPTDEIQIAMKHKEVDILGLDGHIYKGRMDTRLPSILSKDTSGVTKQKAKQPRPHVHRQQSLGDNGQLPSRPQSAQMLAGNNSAPSRQWKDRPVSSEGRLSQPNMAHPPSPSEMANVPAGMEIPMDVPPGEGLEEPTRGPRSTSAHRAEQ
uniref:Glutamine rich 2 n=1 Tax=Equus caballus TaxID=9796 RepID=F7CFI0_HORSE